MSFDGFDLEAIALLANLPAMSADEYAEHKAALRDGLSRPGLALIETVADQLDADLTVAARSSVSPLHRDLRFAPAGSPRHKDHLLLTTWEGADKKSSPILWIRIDASHAGFASGMGLGPPFRDRWREAVGGDAGVDLATELNRLVAELGAEVAGDQLKRVPTPFEPEHERGDLLRRTGFQVRYTEPLPADVGDATFAGWCTDRLGALLDVHRWLRDNVAR